MKRGVLILILFLAGAAGGCAVVDTGAFARLQDEVIAQQKEIAALKEGAATVREAPGAIPGAPPASAEIAGLQRNQADLANDMASVKSELLQATTRADETKVELQKEISRLNGKTDEQAQAIQDIRARTARVAEIEKRLAGVEERLEKMAPGSRASQPPSAGAAPSDWKTPEEMYDYALGQIKAGDPKKGREVLSAFAAKHPDHKLMPNVHYWKGETFYEEKDFENAILAFQDVIDRHPSSDKAPDAMYKQGLSFLRLKDTKNARNLFELLQTKYPKSPAAEKAKQNLSELK